jgi:polyisoprenoid-binding protein YceI
MKKAILALFVVIASVVAVQAQLADGKYILDFNKSSIVWNAKKITGSGHSGTVRVSSGVIYVKGNAGITGKVKIDMNAMTVTDITDAGTNANFLNHLKGDDFFNTVAFPDAMFEVTSVQVAKGNNGTTHNVTGNMTIKGITKALTFPAKITGGGNQVFVEGTVAVDRSQFDVKYGSTAFFDNLGDKAIDNIFNLNIKLVGDLKK